MSRHFTFTAFTNVRPTKPDWAVYMIAGRETCPTTGRVHYQGHLITARKTRLASVIKKWKPHHVEISKDPEASREYCKKEGEWEEQGEWISQGSRTDLQAAVRELVEQKTTIDEIVINNPGLYHQYGRTLEKVVDVQLKKIKRDWMPTCKWIWGPTGVGKTRSICSEEKDLYFFPYEKNGWWDNYEGQEAILFDDFRGQLPLNEVLRICDRYDYSVPRRGRAPIPLVAKRIYFTSCKPPEEVFKENEAIAQLLRRVEVEVMDVV